MEREKFEKELNAWMIFYRDGSVKAQEEKLRNYNNGVLNGIKLVVELLTKYKIIEK